MWYDGLTFRSNKAHHSFPGEAKDVGLELFPKCSPRAILYVC